LLRLASVQGNRDATKRAPTTFVGVRAAHWQGKLFACLLSEILLRVGRWKFCCLSVVHRDKVSVNGVLLSAFVAVGTPTKDGRRKRHFRSRTRVGVPTPMNADNGVSVGRSGGASEGAFLWGME
jgi:hypothetical protein